VTRVFAAFPKVSDLVSTQWIVVICIGLAFFLVQIALTLRFYSRTRGQERILRRLARNFERGGDGRMDRKTLPENFPWLRWVISNFPAATKHPPGNFTREEVLQELDTRIASNGDYLLLQRMGVMAPLLGVVLTVVGFYWLNVSEADESLQSILSAVTPLVAGVGTGAVLALLNQALLHVAGRRVESLRMSARTWFDTVIWSHIGLDTQAATVKAVRAMDRLAGSMGEAADRYSGSSHKIDETTASMQDAASRFREIVQAFSAEIKGIPESLIDVRRATKASAEALQELTGVGTRAVSNLDVSVAAFRTTLDREFATAARLHHQSSGVLAESVRQIGDAAGLLASGAGDLGTTARANADAAQRMDESIRQHVVPGSERFREVVQTLAEQVAASRNESAMLSSKIEALAAEFDKVTNRLAPSVTSFCEAIDHRFGPAMTQQSVQAESIDRSMQRLCEVADSASHGTAALNSILQEVSQHAGQTKTTQQALVEATKNLSEAGRQLRQSITSDVAPSQRAMHEITSSLVESSTQLSNFVGQGVKPATRQLATLQQTLAGLADTVDAIKEFSGARSDIDRLNDTLARASKIADAISGLPEQIREILEQTVNHHANSADSSGRLMSWLSRKPR
jgi:predicted  nucleic acid-binding Zn-ribbon protein